jgi:catechol 2,3-dioxygenase-like lactoylglutathione lyase family enzyme
MTGGRQMTDLPATVHHVALTVTNPELSRHWYQRLLSTAPVLDEDFPAVPEHHQGFHKVVFVLPGGLVLGLIGHPATDQNQRFDEFGSGLDHISFGCRPQRAREVAEPPGRARDQARQHRRGRLRLRLALPRPRQHRPGVLGTPVVGQRRPREPTIHDQPRTAGDRGSLTDGSHRLRA